MLKTPVRSFVREMASRSERKSTRRIILEHEIENLRRILNKRRVFKKGKRAILKNKFRYTVEELRDGVLQAEKETRERTTKKVQKHHTQPEEVPENDTEDEYMSAEEGESPIKDCIVVAR